MTRRTGQQPRQRAAENVSAVCVTCDWSATGRTWRPIKRALAAHKATKHGDLTLLRPSGEPASTVTVVPRRARPAMAGSPDRQTDRGRNLPAG